MKLKYSNQEKWNNYLMLISSKKLKILGSSFGCEPTTPTTLEATMLKDGSRSKKMT